MFYLILWCILGAIYAAIADKNFSILQFVLFGPVVWVLVFILCCLHESK